MPSCIKTGKVSPINKLHAINQKGECFRNKKRFNLNVFRSLTQNCPNPSSQDMNREIRPVPFLKL